MRSSSTRHSLFLKSTTTRRRITSVLTSTATTSVSQNNNTNQHTPHSIVVNNNKNQLFKTTQTLLQQRYYDDEEDGSGWGGGGDDGGGGLDDYTEPLDNLGNHQQQQYGNYDNNDDFGSYDNNNYSRNQQQQHSTSRRNDDFNNNNSRNTMDHDDGYDESGEILPPTSSSAPKRSNYQQQQQQEQFQHHHRDPRRNIEDDDDSPEALDLVSSLGATNTTTTRTETQQQQQQQVKEQETTTPPSSSTNFTPSSTTTTTLFGSNTKQAEQQESAAELQNQQQELPSEISSPSSASISFERHLGQIVKGHLQSVTPGPSNEQIESLLSECKDGKQLNKILDELILPHPMMHDMLNGHGFRVFVFTKVAVAGLRLSQAAPWLRLMRFVRTRGFKLTRTYVTYCLDALRKETSLRFNKEGRNPHIAIDILSNLRYLLLMAAEDSVYCDWVLMTKTLFVVTAVVAIFDRQNLYRSNWPVSGEVPRREGIVSEWVISHERPIDFDRVIQLSDKIVDGLITDVRERFRSRPPFSFVQRLADYYFATDNLDKMICVLEEALEMGIAIGESSTAKLMQLACAFNHPKVPELFVKFRVQLPQCMLAAPDFSRLMFWYCRSGGGNKCPVCSEPYNHRNVSLDQWSHHTSRDQRNCRLLAQARTQKGELENNTTDRVPQCKDWSQEARALFELSQSRAISWTSIEWRGFILCHMFAKREVALEALQLLEDHLQRRAWDDFLAQQVIRLLRYHDPRRIIPTIKLWQDSMNLHISPLVVQEAAVGVMSISVELMKKNKIIVVASDGDNDFSHMFDALSERVEGLNFLTQIARAAEIYTMAYTERTLFALLDYHTEQGDSSEGEQLAVRDFCSIAPRALREEDRKDSCCDIRPATNKKSSVFAEAERFFPALNGGGSGMMNKNNKRNVSSAFDF